jgi:pyrophosphate--fructose-6-phosphate 1-phosphotransferase
LHVEKLIAELNEILAHDVDEAGAWKSKLEPESWQPFDLFFPKPFRSNFFLKGILMAMFR